MKHRIPDVRKELGVSQGELSRRLGISLSMLGKLERNERTMTFPWLEKIADALSVEPNDLLVAGDARVTRSDLVPVRSNVEQDGSIALKAVDLTYSMGSGSVIDDYPEEGVYQIDPGLLRSITRSPPERLFVARGSGDSMFPTLINNDTVIIDTGQRRLTMQDRIWAISLHGAGGIKRLRTIGKSRILVVSDNPAVPDQEADAEDVFIAGRVIWIGRAV
jgi:phage repressor protein C with HTH and peptisase S24 domain